MARDCRIVAVVAEPDEKARAWRACSKAATAVSKLCLFGLDDLVYSYAPMGWPTADWANVVLRVI